MVIVLRCLKLASGVSGGDAERRLMVTEKSKAARDARRAVIKSLFAGTGHRATSKVMGLYRRRVRANLKRLANGK